MSRTKSLWLGLAVLLFNGIHFVWGAIASEVGGFGSLVNPDRLPGLDYERGWYFAIMAIYLALTAFGASILISGRSANEEASR